MPDIQHIVSVSRIDRFPTFGTGVDSTPSRAQQKNKQILHEKALSCSSPYCYCYCFEPPPPPLGQMASARCHATRICVHMLGRFNYRYNLLIYLLAHITNRNSIFLLWGLPPSPLAGGLAPTNRYYWGYCPTFLGGYYRTALAPKARAGSTAHKLLLGLPPLNLSWGVVAQKLHLGYCPKLLRWLPTAKDLAGANAQLLLQLLHNA